MRIFRYQVQALIAALFGLVLIGCVGLGMSVTAFIALNAFLGFLFLLTLLLREETESRLDFRRGTNPKVLGSFLAFVGFLICFGAVQMAMGEYEPAGGRGRAPGLLLDLFIEFFGPWIPALAFALVGVRMVHLGYQKYPSRDGWY